MFSNPGTYDPFGRIAQASRLSVSQRQKRTTPSRSNPSKQFHCSSERYRSLGMGTGVERQFFKGQKKNCPYLVGYSLYYPGKSTFGSPIEITLDIASVSSNVRK
ncbi:MAG: hypothetical protein EZS28_049149 [Streblomastix strix]|uniref:Uncharacterized protein n=1 Tax=Streblomastix strix TaxID=222440 RepID=A0A5J4TAC6_9EUKA|nr:MAG: hypothetical protein EZS28_049149 [Streblomastix strix]